MSDTCRHTFKDLGEKWRHGIKAISLIVCPPLLFSTLAAVNRIKEQYKVSVRIPQDSERSGLVRIEGDPKGVQLARRELIEMVQRMVRSLSLAHLFILVVANVRTHTNLISRVQENERTKDLIVEQKFHRTIIGQKGEKIKEVRDKFPEVNALLDPYRALSLPFITVNLF